MVEKKQLLLVVDVQNDFCDSNGFFPRYHGKRPQGIDEAVNNIKLLIQLFRNGGSPIAYTQAVGNENLLPLTQRERYRQRGLTGFLQTGSWGHDFYQLKPLSAEPVFQKVAYDPFFSKPFKSYALEAGSLLLAGFFSDICIDAIARSADHLGIETSLVADCSASMFRQHEESWRFMQIFYGTKIYPTVKNWLQTNS